jgi:tetratricopeptide (TPR) repeat protein
LNNLATLYTLKENYAGAEPLFQKVLRAKAETIGTENISYANSLHNLALIYFKSENYETAETFYNKAIDIWSDKLGPDHQNVSTGYGHLSQLFKDKGDVENAYHYVYRSLEIDNKLIDQVADFTSERQKLQFLASNRWSLYYCLNLVNQHFNSDKLKIKAAFDAWLQTKGRILNVQKSFQESGIAAENPESAKLFEELNDVRARLSKLAFAAPGVNDETNHKQVKADLEERKERLEARLSRISRSFALNRKVAGADSRQIAKVLSSQTAFGGVCRS